MSYRIELSRYRITEPVKQQDGIQHVTALSYALISSAIYSQQHTMLPLSLHMVPPHLLLLGYFIREHFR